MGKITHGLTFNPATRRFCVAYYGIKYRCYDPEYMQYCNYGARGIKLQPSWENDMPAFVQYVSNLPNCVKGRSLDRIDNDLGYQEGNLRWATRKEQNRNRGMPSTNTSGVCGVVWCLTPAGNTRAVARWQDGDKTKAKSFAVSNYGLLPAFALACQHRAAAITEVNSRGGCYSDKHGK